VPVPTILVVEHQATCPPGWVGEWLTDAGARLRVARPYAVSAAGPSQSPAGSPAGSPTGPPAGSPAGSPELLPRDLRGYDGLVVLGGTMSSGDDQTVPWLEPTKALLRVAAATGVPTLGICLGHQLAAVALGGVVESNPHGKTTGLREVAWDPSTAPGDALVGGLAGTEPTSVAIQWNNDIVTHAPPGSIPLATNERGELLAARFAPTVWGVQVHPEAHAGIVSAWADKDRACAAAQGIDVDAALAEIRAREATLRHTWSGVVARFAQLCRAA
jgi:GMP synthase (glutamine-hydrolysing)